MSPGCGLSVCSKVLFCSGTGWNIYFKGQGTLQFIDYSLIPVPSIGLLKERICFKGVKFFLVKYHPK